MAKTKLNYMQKIEIEIIKQLQNDEDCGLRAEMSNRISEIIRISNDGRIGISDYNEKISEVLAWGKTLSDNFWKN